MSRLEVAGVASSTLRRSRLEVTRNTMAILSLLIESLEAYQQLPRPSEELQALQILAKTEFCLFQTMIESLATSNHPDQLAELGQNLGPNILHNITFRSNIRESRGPSADVFIDLIVAYGEKLDKIQRELEQVSVSSVA